MLLKCSEIAKKANITKAAVSNWVNRSKKIFVNKDGFVDTEDDKNKSFLMKKVPVLYESQDNTEHISEVFDELSANETFKNFDNINITEYLNIDIDTISLEDAKKILGEIIHLSPKRMLTYAQYKKADNEGNLKKIELDEKLNRKFDREIITNHLFSFLKIMHVNSRQIIYGSVDKIIRLAMKDGLNSRGKIIELVDEKYVGQVMLCVDSLKKLMEIEYPLGVLPKDSKEDNVQ